MKVCIVTALNNRPAVSRILFNTWKRLDVTGDVISIAAAVTEQVDADLCKKHNVPFVQMNNVPGKKWNAALSLAMSNKAHTHFLIMGDDDSISREGYSLLFREAGRGHDNVGFRSNGYYDLTTGAAMIHDYARQYRSADKLIGAGRLISRKAIERVTNLVRVEWKKDFEDRSQGRNEIMHRDQADYLQGIQMVVIKEDLRRGLWSDTRKNGLDYESELRLTLAGFPPKAVDDGRIHVTDFKSHPTANIWPFSNLEGKCVKCRGEDVTWYMNEKEIECLRRVSASCDIG